MGTAPDGPVMTGAVAEAVAAAVAWHGDQVRKGTTVPYVSHLLQVAGLVLEHGGDEDQAVAALLHDAVEDTDATAEDVATRFGRRVARIVADCTDTLPGDRPEDKSPWILRKRTHLEHLRFVAADSALVIACDKRHNLGSLVADLRDDGVEATAARFSSSSEQWVWYYREALDRLRGRIPDRLERELDALTAELAGLVGEP